MEILQMKNKIKSNKQQKSQKNKCLKLSMKQMTCNKICSIKMNHKIHKYRNKINKTIINHEIKLSDKRIIFSQFNCPIIIDQTLTTTFNLADKSKKVIS